LLKKGAKTLGREALKTGLNIAGDVVQGRNIKQAAEARLKSTGQNLFLRLAGPFIARCPGGPTVSIAFWNKFCPVDFNRASAACLIFLPCTTSPAIFNPVKNGTCTPQLMRMHEIRTGFI
jgi:hypothetical protein